MVAKSGTFTAAPPPGAGSRARGPVSRPPGPNPDRPGRSTLETSPLASELLLCVICKMR